MQIHIRWIALNPPDKKTYVNKNTFHIFRDAKLDKKPGGINSNIPFAISHNFLYLWLMVTFQAIAIKKHTSTSSISFCTIQLIPSVIGAPTNVIILECRLANSYGCSHSLIILDNPYPEPVHTGWSSVHWNATGMPLVDPVYTGMPLGDPANTCRVHWNTTGKT